MKQYIVTNDLNQLSDKGKEKLRAWWKPESADLFYDPKNRENFNLEDERETTGVIFDYDIRPFEDGGESYGEPAFQERGEDWNPTTSYKKNCLPLLSIGQMIEFLNEEWGFMKGDHEIQRLMDECWRIDSGLEDPELCDVLWEQVKRSLEK